MNKLMNRAVALLLIVGMVVAYVPRTYAQCPPGKAGIEKNYCDLSAAMPSETFVAERFYDKGVAVYVPVKECAGSIKVVSAVSHSPPIYGH